MSDIQDYYDEQRRQQEEQARQNDELRRLYAQVLKRAPTAKEYGISREGTSPVLALRIAAQHQRELATGKQDEKNQYQAPLTDPARREAYRKLLLDFGTQVNVQDTLRSVPVPFLSPDTLVRREQVDTEPEVSAFLRGHGGDTALNRQLLKAALDYGGLSIEPTPYGTLTQAPRKTSWRMGAPGTVESQLGGQAGLSPAQLSAIAGERQSGARLKGDNPLEDLITKGILTGIFATAGGLIAGPALGGLAAGAGIPGTAATAGAAGTGWAGGIGAAGGGAVGGGIGGGIAGRGDPNAIWQGALGGGVTGGLGFGLPGGSTPATGALKGAGIGGAGNLVSQGLQGDDFDWSQLATALAGGAASGAASGLGSSGPAEGIGMNVARGVGGALLNAGGKDDPLAGVNAQLDRNAVQREQDRGAQMQAAQDEWKRRFGAAQADALSQWQAQGNVAREAQMAAFREQQQAWEAQRGQYEAKLQAFLAERQTQIEDALRSMGLAEPGIASLLADRQKEIDAGRAEEASQRAALMESRTFFPSQLLEQTGPTGASGLLVPHSPPPVRFGQEGLPQSFADYGQAPAPTFSSEGFLPSGSMAAAEPPAVAPMGRTRAPRYMPTLLNGLTRSPYLRYA